MLTYQVGDKWIRFFLDNFHSQPRQTNEKSLAITVDDCVSISHRSKNCNSPRTRLFMVFFQSCQALLSDPATKPLLSQKFDLLVLDGAYPECALALQYRLDAPFMFINTVGFYTKMVALSGTPTPCSITPFFHSSFTDDMNFLERVENCAVSVVLNLFHSVRTETSLTTLSQQKLLL